MDHDNRAASEAVAAAQHPMPAPAPTTGNGPPRRRRLAAIGGVLLVIGGAYGVYRYIWSLHHETTDDAQVEGHIHAISSRVAGYVAQVCVEDNQVVAAGDVLVRIRPEDYQARVKLAEANLAQAEAQAQAAEHSLAALRRSTNAAIAQAQAGVQLAEAQIEAARLNAVGAEAKLAEAGAGFDQAQALVVAAQADADYASFNLQRVSALHQQNDAAEDEARRADAGARAATAKLAAAREAVKVAAAQRDAAQSGRDTARNGGLVANVALDEARGKLEEKMAGPDDVRVAEAKLALAQAGAQAARAQLDLAKLDLDYCTITAPAAGLVSKRSVEAGQFLQPGQPILAVVPLHDTWVVANLKETELRNVRTGQPARLRVDAYPDHPFEGVIDSFAAGTGARFSLLPAENATGNYVKIVQRVPVKIVLTSAQRDPQRPRRPGMNVVVTIDTNDQPPAPAAR